MLLRENYFVEFGFIEFVLWNHRYFECAFSIYICLPSHTSPFYLENHCFDQCSYLDNSQSSEEMFNNSVKSQRAQFEKYHIKIYIQWVSTWCYRHQKYMWMKMLWSCDNTVMWEDCSVTGKKVCNNLFILWTKLKHEFKL